MKTAGQLESASASLAASAKVTSSAFSISGKVALEWLWNTELVDLFRLLDILQELVVESDNTNTSTCVVSPNLGSNSWTKPLPQRRTIGDS